MTQEIHINEQIIIPLSTVDFRFSRSGGPGGQHANTADTRVTLVYSVTESDELASALSKTKFKRIVSRLKPHLNNEGFIQISSQETRSQLRNKEIVIERFRTILKQALIEPKIRKKTVPSKAARQKRLNDKKRRSDVKAGRRKNWG